MTILKQLDYTADVRLRLLYNSINGNFALSLLSECPRETKEAIAKLYPLLTEWLGREQALLMSWQGEEASK